jgi:hypothetical protein
MLNTNEILQKILTEIDVDNNNLKILFILPESAGDIFLATSLLRSLKEIYQNKANELDMDDCDIYFACKKEYFDILKNNPYIKKTLEYDNIMDIQPFMEGYGKWVGLFDISIMASVMTQRLINYLNNGIGCVAFDLRYSKE